MKIIQGDIIAAQTRVWLSRRGLGIVQDIIESVEQRYNTEFSIYKLGG